ncbi:MAG: hypothetical protein ACFFB6_13085, partial [Promethearchaeota archaeon]
MNNTNFDYPTSWVSIEEGDETDVDSSISNGYGNFVIYGDSGEKRIDEPLNNGEWQAYNNPMFPISPDTNGSSSAGLYITHLWNENIDQTRNTPSIHWKRTIPMGINMSDYIITDASLEVIYNASVQALGHDGGGIEVPGDYTEGEFPPGDTQLATGDFATFYVLISDIDNINSYLIAINKTTNLGEDARVITNHTDTPLDVVPKNILISYLNSVLQYNYVNFTITLGIDLYCEDNEYNVDIDNWKMLIMRSFNLTFTYEKKIDKFTSISWEQTGNQISGENIQIANAVLNFDFKIDNTVFSSLSPNSEIQVFINNKQLIRSIRLSRATEILQEAYPGGIDVTSFISKDIEIAISIQLYLKDEFGLGENITISIDNVDFLITYVVYIDDIFSEPLIFQILLYVASIAGLSIGGYLLAYQRVLKYPKPVRKIRKYRRTLARKNEPSVSIVNRKDAFMKEYKQELHKTST